MPTMPEALLLVALHDEKGSVHPAAFMAIDHGLRGAVLAELRERGRVVTRKDRIRHEDGEPVGLGMLERALEILADAPSPGAIEDWLTALERDMPHIQAHSRTRLVNAGILVSQELDREHELARETKLPMVDTTLEDQIHDWLLAGVDKGEGISRRVGTLLALVQATNLTKVVFLDRAARKKARDLARWVMERDSIARAVDVAVQKAQGTWEP